MAKWSIFYKMLQLKLFFKKTPFRYFNLINKARNKMIGWTDPNVFFMFNTNIQMSVDNPLVL